ncbi:MAG: insulinase family protein [Gammaproteobacteria bacterium]|nr:insulinase family protein [Gammaproteobacteria bacterium]
MKTRWILHLVCLGALGLGAACTETPTGPVKSPNDQREYRNIVLPNGLRALLIRSDWSRSGAAVSVARGSQHEPDAHLGIAHFVEHMLFIATDKYPKVDEFGEFVSKHGGDTNAYTEVDRTTYYFDIEPEHLPEALDRFAQFFVFPRFDADYLEREKHAVQGEFQMQRKVDDWRGDAVHKRLMNPAHPGSRFDWGNLRSLRDVGVAEARAFFETNYSADTMALAVLGADDLDALQELVEETFGDVVNRGLGPKPVNPPIYEGQALPLGYAWRTVSETRTLSFRFPVPSNKPHYRSKPGVFLATLVGHEGRNSLHRVLSGRGWIDGLVATSHDLDDWNGIFDIDLTLTEAGKSHVDEIADLTYAWIDLIRRQGVEGWRYDEEARLAELRFRFQEMTEPVESVIAGAEGLLDYAPEDVLRADFAMDSFEEPLIRRYLDRLVPENSIVVLSGPDIEGDRVEYWFGVPWRLGSVLVPDDVAAGLELPGPNPYLPENVDLVFEPASLEPPVRLETETSVQTWHAPDTEFGLPVSFVNLDLQTAEPLDADGVVLATLHARLVERALNPRAYAAREAGLVVDIEATRTGLRISVQGIGDKHAELFDDVLTTFIDPEIDAKMFAAVRATLRREYANLSSVPPYQQVDESLSRLIHSERFPLTALIDAADRATPATLAAWRAETLVGLGATLFVYGNLRDTDARGLAATAQRLLGVVDRPYKVPQAKRLAGARHYEHPVDHDDAAYLLYIQGASNAMTDLARLGLIGRMLGARYFTALRTERQLGYVVAAHTDYIARHPGLVFTVQASSVGVREIEALTQQFLEDQRDWLRELTPDEFEAYREGYIAPFQRPSDFNHHERIARLLDDLTHGVLTFDSKVQLKDAVAGLEAADVAEAYEELIDPARGNRLTIFSRGKPGMAPTHGDPITSIEAFKGAKQLLQ